MHEEEGEASLSLAIEANRNDGIIRQGAIAGFTSKCQEAVQKQRRGSFSIAEIIRKSEQE